MKASIGIAKIKILYLLHGLSQVHLSNRFVAILLQLRIKDVAEFIHKGAEDPW